MRVSDIKLTDGQITFAIHSIFNSYAYYERAITRIRRENRGNDNAESLRLVHTQHGLDDAIEALGLREELKEYLNDNGGK